MPAPRHWPPRADRGPLRVLFAITSMPVGGAETLLVNLVRGLDRSRFEPHVCCLKELGPLGEELVHEIPIEHSLLAHKYDLRVFPRLVQLLRTQRIDAVVTVGAGDKMFWGRLAARRVGTPVVLSALHSTGWPDSVNWLNRQLTPWTDGFIAVAEPHGEFMVRELHIPPEKIHVIPNGVDTQRFRPQAGARMAMRRQLGIPSEAPVCGVVAALRPEKNHSFFLQTAAQVRTTLPDVRFVIVGDGPERQHLETLTASLELQEQVLFLGSRGDIPELLPAFDLFALTSHNEANPVSILEALSCEVPVIAPRVGSLHETVIDDVTGFLVPPGDRTTTTQRWLQVLQDRPLRERLGAGGRQLVIDDWSLARMVQGYEQLIESIYQGKTQPICRAREPEDSPATVSSD